MYLKIIFRGLTHTTCYGYGVRNIHKDKMYIPGKDNSSMVKIKRPDVEPT